MGALRRPDYRPSEPQIIVLPYSHGRTAADDAPKPQSSLWTRFRNSEAYSVAVFEVKAFGVVGIMAVATFMALAGGYKVKGKVNYDINPDFSYTEAYSEFKMAYNRMP